MAAHQEKTGLIKESLNELLHIAGHSINYRKIDHNIWGKNANGGVLAFPSAIILFSIIDCLGSVFIRDENIDIIIDGKNRKIKTTSQHIYILNSKYFNLELSQFDLNNIYINFRCTLTHNSLMPEGYYILSNDRNRIPFEIGITEEFDNRIYFLNLNSLYHVTKKAVELFISDLDCGVIKFEATELNKTIDQRSKRARPHPIPNQPGQSHIPMKKWIKKTEIKQNE